MEHGQILHMVCPGGILRKPINSDVARIIVGGQEYFARGSARRALHSSGRLRVGSEYGAVRYGRERDGMYLSRRVMLVRREDPYCVLPNLIEGDLLDEESNDNAVTLQFRVQGTRLVPGERRDLEIEVPVYVYERLNLAAQRHWLVLLLNRTYDI